MELIRNWDDQKISYYFGNSWRIFLQESSIFLNIQLKSFWNTQKRFSKYYAPLLPHVFRNVSDFIFQRMNLLNDKRMFFQSKDKTEQQKIFLHSKSDNVIFTIFHTVILTLVLSTKEWIVIKSETKILRVDTIFLTSNHLNATM